jgi:hypothetical protein
MKLTPAAFRFCCNFLNDEVVENFAKLFNLFFDLFQILFSLQFGFFFLFRKYIFFFLGVNYDTVLQLISFNIEKRLERLVSFLGVSGDKRRF